MRTVAVTPQKRVGIVIAAAGWLFIAAMTLFPHPELTAVVEDLPVWCVVCGGLGLEDVVLNVLLFIPLGLGLGLLGWSYRRAVLAVFLTTLTVETLQLSLIAGRDASLGDVLTNTIGGFIGVLLARHWHRIIFPGRRNARGLALLAAAAWLGVEAGTGFLLGVALPAKTYFGQWAPDLGQFARFEGKVLAVTLGETPMSGTALPESGAIRLALMGDHVSIEVTAVTAGPTDQLAPIFSIFDSEQHEILLVGQDGVDLVFRLRMRVSDLLMRNPAIRIPGALAVPPGDTVRIEAGTSRRMLMLKIERKEGRMARVVTPSPNWGWSFVLPFGYSFGPEEPWLTVLWVAGLLIPLGYWGARGVPVAGEFGQALVGGAIVILSGLGLVPLLFGLPPVHWSEWAAALVGLATGGCLGTRSAPR